MSGLLSDFGSKGGGPAFTTPNNLPRGWFDPQMKTAGGTTVSASAAGFASAITTHGFGAVASIVGADTYVTVCDVTGEGTLYYAISTAFSSTSVGTSVTLRITLDGKVYTITMTSTLAPTVADRLVLGPVTILANVGSGPETPISPNIASDYGYHTDNRVSGGVQRMRAGATILIPNMIDTLNLPRCKFETSLKVEAKGSVLGAGEQVKASAIYLLRG